jgi:NAD-dependent dihydropyrimidine dehydrogenase PreA subunit
MAGPRPWLPRPLDCVACAACVFVCPADALRMEIVGHSPGECF